MRRLTKSEVEKQVRAREAAARSLFAAAGLAVEEIDAQHWRVFSAAAPGRAYLFWPVSGNWRSPNGAEQGRQILPLIRRLETGAGAA